MTCLEAFGRCGLNKGVVSDCVVLVLLKARVYSYSASERLANGNGLDREQGHGSPRSAEGRFREENAKRRDCPSCGVVLVETAKGGLGWGRLVLQLFRKRSPGSSPGCPTKRTKNQPPVSEGVCFPSETRFLRRKALVCCTAGLCSQVGSAGLERRGFVPGLSDRFLFWEQHVLRCVSTNKR